MVHQHELECLSVFAFVAHVYIIPQTAQLKFWDRAYRRVCVFFFDKKLVAVYAYAIYFASQIVKRGLHRTGLEGRIRRSFVLSTLTLESSGIGIRRSCVLLGPVMSSLTLFLPSVVLQQMVLLHLIYSGYSNYNLE